VIWRRLTCGVRSTNFAIHSPQHVAATGVDIIPARSREVSSSTTCSEVARWDGLLGSIEGKTRAIRACQVPVWLVSSSSRIKAHPTVPMGFLSSPTSLPGPAAKHLFINLLVDADLLKRTRKDRSLTASVSDWFGRFESRTHHLRRLQSLGSAAVKSGQLMC